MKRVRIDKLGRIVIPIGYRKILNITTGTDLMIECNNRKISIFPFEYTCKLCDKNIGAGQDIPLCEECIRKIKGLPYSSF